ncbi:MAG: cytochrome b/b6 domain-containing protein [Thermoanaerobaculia bacterium]
MSEAADFSVDEGAPPHHARWVRISHWVAALSFFLLVFSGVEILMVHPRLYWGETGNDLTPALFELPISRNYKHGGWDEPKPFIQVGSGVFSASRTYDIFNKNGWGRSLHFLAAWCLVLPGAVYLLAGLFGGHLRGHVWPGAKELSPRLVWRDVAEHLHFRIPKASGGPRYGVLQKITYSWVVFLALPLMVVSGLTMSPAVTTSFPFLLSLFGGYQSARTIHFFTFAALVVFLLVHVVMVVKSGFRRQMRSMTVEG